MIPLFYLMNRPALKNLSNQPLYQADNYIATLKKQFPNIKDEITNAPLLIYIEDGEAVEAMSSELKTIDYKVLNKMIEKYGIE